MGTDNLARHGVIRTTADVHAPSAATAAVLTYAALANVRHVIDSVTFSYDSTPTGGALTIADGASTVFSLDVAAAGVVHLSFYPPLRGTENTALVITLASGAGSVKGKVNAQHRAES